MATELTPDVPTPKPTLNMEDFADAIGKAVAAGIAANAPPKKISFGQYQRLHPVPKLKRTYYQNGFQYDPGVAIGREIELLERITHSGRYVNRMVEVIVSDEGSDERVDFRWACKSPDQRFELKGIAPSFENMLQQILDAQKVERADLEAQNEKKDVRRRQFGDTAASREAREKAGAV